MLRYKLAFIIERYFRFGGLQRDMHKFAHACAEDGHDVKVFTNEWDGPEDRLFGVRIMDLRSSFNHKTIKRIEGFVRSLRDSREFDCIVGFNRMGSLDVCFCGDPCLKAKLEHEGRTWLRFLPRYRTYLQLERAVFDPSSSTEAMIISQDELDTIRQMYGTPSDHLHLLPPGIDRERLAKYSMTDDQRLHFRKQHGVGARDFLIVAVGSSFMTKGVDRAISAIASLPTDMKNRCRYVVIGQGDDRRFQAIAANAGIGDRITFTGGREDAGAFYYAGDLLLHPARTETAGHILLEAMLCSLPVIVTEHCGYARYVRDANGGVLCPDPFDQNQLNAILKDMLKDDHARRQYSLNGLNYTRTADIYSMTDRAVTVILNRAARNKAAR